MAAEECWSSTAYQRAHALLEAINTFINSPPLTNNNNKCTEHDTHNGHIDQKMLQIDHLEALEALNTSQEALVNPLQKSMEVLFDALRLYGPDRIYVAFNGGKDASISLYLYLACLVKYQESLQETKEATAVITPLKKPKCVYFRNKETEFEEVIQFVEETSAELDLALTEHTGDITAGTAKCIEQQKSSPIVFVMGTRYSDPSAVKSSWFTPSSVWMPPFLRVNPLIGWNYQMTWSFFKFFSQPYCSLYNDGFSSLGNKLNTIRNPALLNTNTSQYLPAYFLKDWSKERGSRLHENETKQNGMLNEIIHVEGVDCIDTLKHSNAAIKFPRTAALTIIGVSSAASLLLHDAIHSAVIQLKSKGIEVQQIAYTTTTTEAVVAEAERQSKIYDMVIAYGDFNSLRHETSKQIIKNNILNSNLLFTLRRALQGRCTQDSDVEVNSSDIGLLKLNQLKQQKADVRMSSAPLFRCGNIFLPSDMSTSIECCIHSLCDYYLLPKKIFSKQMRLNCSEEVAFTVLYGLLSDPSTHFLNASVSYPIWSEGKEPKTVVTLESTTEEALLIDMKSLVS